jgi:hypothetical protein
MTTEKQHGWIFFLAGLSWLLLAVFLLTGCGR